MRADDRVVAVLAIDGEAALPALEPALHALIAEVPAAIALQEVAADRSHVPDLRRRRVAQRFGNDRQ